MTTHHTPIPRRRAWDVIAYTFNGSAYCPECAPSPLTRNGSGESPYPVFVSDEFEDHSCDVCHEPIE